MKQIIQVKVDSLKRGRYQPRKTMSDNHIKDLALSLSLQGQKIPISIKGIYDEQGDLIGGEIISGEYRWRAAMHLGWDKIDAIVSEGNGRNHAVEAMVSNSGLPLNPIEEAEGYARLMVEFDMTQAQVAKECGKGRDTSQISRAVKLLQLPLPVRDLIASGDLSGSHGDRLLKCPSHLMVDMANKSVKFGWSRKQLEQNIDRVSADIIESGRTKKDTRTMDWIEIESMLAEKIGVPISIKESKTADKKTAYKVSIDLVSEQQMVEFVKYMTQWNVKASVQ